MIHNVLLIDKVDGSVVTRTRFWKIDFTDPDIQEFLTGWRDLHSTEGLSADTPVYVGPHKVFHGVVDNEFTKDSLLDMYLKCGALDDSHRLFDEMSKTNIISWNIMISGYAQHGYGHKAL